MLLVPLSILFMLASIPLSHDVIDTTSLHVGGVGAENSFTPLCHCLLVFAYGTSNNSLCSHKCSMQAGRLSIVTTAVISVC